MKKLLFGTATFLLLFGFALSEVNAQSVVVPNANESVEGNGNNIFPFSTDLAQRYQQIYDSSQFSSGGNIEQLKFRLEQGRAGFNSETIPNILIQLSTTTTTPATLSNVYANNAGSDVTTVFDGALTISAADCAAGGPCPFDIVINLQTPFNYDPDQGNLLLDVTNIEPVTSSITAFDAVEDAQSITRRVFNNVIADTGIVGDIGLVTQFVFVDVPPPPTITNVPTLSEWGLIAMAGILGIAGFIVIRRRQITA